MTNRSKQKGTSFETLIRDYLKEQWSDDIERLPLSGEKDRGDIANFRVGANRRLVALELKNRTQVSLSQWVKEAQEEAINYGAVAGVVIHKRKGKGAAEDQFVTMTVREFLDIIHAAAS
jgi:hypothetical protein